MDRHGETDERWTGGSRQQSSKSSMSLKAYREDAPTCLMPSPACTIWFTTALPPARQRFCTGCSIIGSGTFGSTILAKSCVETPTLRATDMSFGLLSLPKIDIFVTTGVVFPLIPSIVSRSSTWEEPTEGCTFSGRLQGAVLPLMRPWAS